MKVLKSMLKYCSFVEAEKSNPRLQIFSSSSQNILHTLPG
jgi:hypothetical protein